METEAKDPFTPEQWEVIHSLHKEMKRMGQALFVVNRCQSVLERVLLRKGVVTAKELREEEEAFKKEEREAKILLGLEEEMTPDFEAFMTDLIRRVRYGDETDNPTEKGK